MTRKNIITKSITAMAYAYIILPMIIFLIGWCAWYISIPGTIILCISFYRIINTTTLPVASFEWNKHDIEKLVFIIGIITLWVCFSGIGGFVWQNADHGCRNAIFDILIEYDWPVVTEVLVGEEIQLRSLVYYIGFWLPAALVGKLLVPIAGYYFLVLWAVLGISLFYYLVCLFRQKIQIWPLVLFIFMSGLDIWGYYIIGNDFTVLSNTFHIEWWSETYQFSSFTTQLFWVFNQALPAWLIFMLLYMQRNNRFIVFILSFALLPSTFPFVGLLPFLLYFVFSRKYDNLRWGSKEWWRFWFKDTFTFENIAGGGLTGIISFVYLINNSASQNIESIAKSISTTIMAIMSPAMPLMASTTPINLLNPFTSSITSLTATVTPFQEQVNVQIWRIMIWIVFIIVEVGVYWLVLYKYQKKNPLFYIMLIWLGICPWFSVGGYIDFCMRASIPALVFLYLLIIQTLDTSYAKKDYAIILALSVLLVVGSVTPTNEINRTIANTSQSLNSGELILKRRASDEEILNGYNFSGDVNNSIFFQYFSKDFR